MKIRKISWDKQAINYFQDAIRYIREDSPQNADKVKKEILGKIRELSTRPEIHKPDKYKTDNPGNYRAFELYRFRVGVFV
jgi:plasmid stabilization system protein ParE